MSGRAGFAGADRRCDFAGAVGAPARGAEGRLVIAATMAGPLPPLAGQCHLCTTKKHARIRMAGKVIAITGANGGLGRALAQFFAEGGDNVVLLGRKFDKVQEVAAAIGERATPVACDVGSAESVRSAFATIAAKYPKIDVLINNAAIFHPFLIEEATDEQILAPVLANLAGPILCTRSAIPLLGRGGHIINISSESIVVPFPHLSVYQATKAGLECFSEHMQRELEDKGIRVTVVRAGQMMGPGMSLEMEPVAAQRFGMEAARRGINMRERGITLYHSTLPIFRTLVDLAPDLHVGIVTLQSRVPGETPDA
jgi:meso-butanediol dehydrogenase/(S,S)-butanediol dehydrogenase/diacetyl reductase